MPSMMYLVMREKDRSGDLPSRCSFKTSGVLASYMFTAEPCKTFFILKEKRVLQGTVVFTDNPD